MTNIDRINFEGIQSMPPVIAMHILVTLQKRIGTNLSWFPYPSWEDLRDAIGRNWKLILDNGGEKTVKIDDIRAGTTPQAWVSYSLNLYLLVDFLLTVVPSQVKTSPRRETKKAEGSDAGVPKTGSKASISTASVLSCPLR